MRNKTQSIIFAFLFGLWACNAPKSEQIQQENPKPESAIALIEKPEDKQIPPKSEKEEEKTPPINKGIQTPHTTSEKATASKNKQSTHNNSKKHIKQSIQQILPKEGSFGIASKFEKPFPSIKEHYEETKIKANHPTTVQLLDGSTLDVPSQAFVNDEGEVITGEVTLKYQPYQEAASIIASGIPMTVHDQDGQKKQLESAGMFQIQAYAKGRAVHIAKGKAIQVNLKSDISTQGYDFYRMDESDGNPANMKWENLSKKELVQPSDEGAFQLKLNTRKYPELLPLAQQVWHTASDDAKKHPRLPQQAWVLNTVWDNIQISKPKFETNTITKIPQTNNGYQLSTYISSDSQFVFTQTDKELTMRDWNGKAIRKFQLSSGDYTGSLVEFFKETPFFKIKDKELTHQRHRLLSYDSNIDLTSTQPVPFKGSAFSFYSTTDFAKPPLCFVLVFR